MLRIAVCDDEPIVAQSIREMTAGCLPDSMISVYPNGAELLAADVDFDIVLLDIQMEGLNGIEAARSLRALGKDSVIIFITAVKEYVFDAFDVAALHYLLKPVREDKLREVLGRALKEFEKKAAQSEKQIFVKTRDKSYTISIADILYFENDRRKIVVHTRTGTISFYGVMAELEEKTGAGFFRSHRGFLVNMAHVTEYDKENIYLTNGEKVYLAKEKYPDFVKRYMRFLRNGGVSYA